MVRAVGLQALHPERRTPLPLTIKWPAIKWLQEPWRGPGQAWGAELSLYKGPAGWLLPQEHRADPTACHLLPAVGSRACGEGHVVPCALCCADCVASGFQEAQRVERTENGVRTPEILGLHQWSAGLALGRPTRVPEPVCLYLPGGRRLKR